MICPNAIYSLAHFQFPQICHPILTCCIFELTKQVESGIFILILVLQSPILCPNLTILFPQAQGPLYAFKSPRESYYSSKAYYLVVLNPVVENISLEMVLLNTYKPTH